MLPTATDLAPSRRRRSTVDHRVTPGRALCAARADALRTLHRLARILDDPIDEDPAYLREARLAAVAILRIKPVEGDDHDNYNNNNDNGNDDPPAHNHPHDIPDPAASSSSNNNNNSIAIGRAADAAARPLHRSAPRAAIDGRAGMSPMSCHGQPAPRLAVLLPHTPTADRRAPATTPCPGPASCRSSADVRRRGLTDSPPRCPRPPRLHPRAPPAPFHPPAASSAR